MAAVVRGIFSRVIEPGSTVEYEADMDTQLVNVALEGEEEGRTVLKMKYLDYSGVSYSDDEDAKMDDVMSDSAEEKEVIICSLISGKIEQANISVLLNESGVYEFNLTGPNKVHLIGHYVHQFDPFQDDYPYSDEEDLSEDDNELDSEEEALHDPDLPNGMLLNDDDSKEDDSDRFAEIHDEPSKLTELKSSSAKPVKTEEPKSVEANTEIDLSGLSKNQRKKVLKKMKAEGNSEARVTAVNGAKETLTNINGRNTMVETTTKSTVVVQKADGEIAKTTAKKASRKITLENGVIIEDHKIGAGPKATNGSKVGVRYIGRLQNGKQFDANTKGNPFEFRLGQNEVIKGWDTGIVGMQPGGERRLTIPPSQGYGKQGTDGIPSNSTLIFEVKLLHVK